MVVHHIPRGTVVVVPEGCWRHGTGELRLQVARVLHELNRHETDWCWVEGTRLGGRPRWIQAQIRVDTLPRPGAR
jgi:hypothetical protein